MALVDDDLLQRLLEFRRERNWEQFHTPRNLSATLCIEAAELLECFQWARDADLQNLVEDEREAIEDEIADITITLGYLCHDLGVSINDVVMRKLEKNRKKYPADKARGTSRKYDRL